MNIDELMDKFEYDVFKNLDITNFNKIINFLLQQGCDYVEDIVTDYIDLFNISYDEFVNKYNLLNKKYNGIFLEMASLDMNLFEEFYN